VERFDCRITHMRWNHLKKKKSDCDLQVAVYVHACFYYFQIEVRFLCDFLLEEVLQ
jgi:hypothetical protein